jgi:5-methyltetrahydropteroyltriglutamate--homocysteine methyltransferase
MKADVTGRGVTSTRKKAQPKKIKRQQPKKSTPKPSPPPKKVEKVKPIAVAAAAYDNEDEEEQFSTWAMPRYPNMICTSHVGSLPRAKNTTDQYKELESVIRKQLDIGITYINDGEVGRLDYSSNAIERMTGFEVKEDAPMAPQPQDLSELPSVERRFIARAGLITLNKKVKTVNPVCTGEIKYVGHTHLHENIRQVKQMLKRNNAGLPGQAFWTVPSPGTMANFFSCEAKNIYPSYESYLRAIAKALSVEYRTAVSSGFVLQVDCPDFAMSRHTKFANIGMVAWKRFVALHVRVLNDALEGIPPEKVRIHLCWGNYAGTHHRDIGIEHVLPQAFKVNAQGLSFEGGNNRHAADHVKVSKLSIPKNKVLYPGVIDTCSTSVESADIVCQRILIFAKIVGPDRVVACTDCGFATTAETQGVPADVAWMKIRALVAGAKQASSVLFPKVVPAFIPRPSKRVFYFCSNVDKGFQSTWTSGEIETRLIFVNELSGKDAVAVASHIRLFVDVPFAFETDGSPMAAMFVKVLCDHLADGRRNCPLFPLEALSLSSSKSDADADVQVPEKILSQADMVIDTTGSTPKLSYDVVVVGGGVVGLLAAKKLLDAGIDVCLVEKEWHVGGIWTTFANDTSQVNSSEGSYRIFEDYRKRANRDHSSTTEVRADILLIANELKDKKRLFTNTRVENVCPSGASPSPTGRKEYSVHIVPSPGNTGIIKCQGVIMAVNDRVGKPRPIQWPHREQFAGQVVDGFGGDAEKQKINWVGKNVVIVGMGAFAVENARTALERGAAHVTVLARRHGTVCPKFIDYINFVHRRSAENTSAQDGAMDTSNNSKNMFLWRKLYEESFATMPECWLGQIKHTGHTISVSDVWFVAHYLGLLETHVGEISHFVEDGVVLTPDKDSPSEPTGCHIPADVVVRCTGFERNACLVPQISPYSTMSRINYLDENVMYLADAYIDDDAFNSFFGSSVVEMSKFYIMVYEHFFNNPSEKDRAKLSDSFLQTDIVSIENRAWSHYISGANFLVDNVPDIKAKADKLVNRRFLDFTETQTVQEYVAANKREWEELHDLLAQSTVDTACCLQYPEWNV